MPEIRPFSEDRKQRSLTSQYRVRERRKRKDSDNIPHYKDRTYLSYLYSWAKADQVTYLDQFKADQVTYLDQFKADQVTYLDQFNIYF